MFFSERPAWAFFLCGELFTSPLSPYPIKSITTVPENTEETIDCMTFGIHPLGEAINHRKLPFSVFSVPFVVIELRFLGLSRMVDEPFRYRKTNVL